jgi:hypothetical protein
MKSIKQACVWCKKMFLDYQGKKRLRCGSCNTKIRRFRAKLAAIMLLGGKCRRCGYADHPAALEFHHLGDKDFAIGMVANKKWGSIVGEIKKCELLCSNCHRVEHSERYNEDFIEMALGYAGPEAFEGYYQMAVDSGFLEKIKR